MRLTLGGWKQVSRCSPICPAEENNHSCWSAGYAPANGAQHAVCLHCGKGGPLTPVQPVSHEAAPNSTSQPPVRAVDYSSPGAGLCVCLGWTSWSSCRTIPPSRVSLLKVLSPSLRTNYSPPIWYHLQTWGKHSTSRCPGHRQGHELRSAPGSASAPCHQQLAS